MPDGGVCAAHLVRPSAIRHFTAVNRFLPSDNRCASGNIINIIASQWRGTGLTGTLRFADNHHKAPRPARADVIDSRAQIGLLQKIPGMWSSMLQYHRAQQAGRESYSRLTINWILLTRDISSCRMTGAASVDFEAEPCSRYDYSLISLN